LLYRDSRFKSREPDRYLICSVRMRLDAHFKPRLEYAGLEAELQKAGVIQPSARDVSEAVVRIRQQKLPDPAVTGNAGSFFKNPVLDQERAASLQDLFPQLPAWRLSGDEMKLSAAWMIEHCGFKGHRAGGVGVSTRHALVLLNFGSAMGMEILELARAIQNRVYSTFGVHLEPEPRIIDFKEHSR
jgi:UDP-N-acetylmuramate dehydrogenase